MAAIHTLKWQALCHRRAPLKHVRFAEFWFVTTANFAVLTNRGAAEILPIT